MRGSPTPLLAAALALALACVHHPRKIELGTHSREDALRLCESALRTRFPAVHAGDSRLSLLRTAERYPSLDGLERSRAFVALVPGEEGWAAELTVVRETLDAEPDALSGVPRWRYAGRDAPLETALAGELARAKSAAASRPAAP